MLCLQIATLAFLTAFFPTFLPAFLASFPTCLAGLVGLVASAITRESPVLDEYSGIGLTVVVGGVQLSAGAGPRAGTGCGRVSCPATAAGDCALGGASLNDAQPPRTITVSATTPQPFAAMAHSNVSR